MGFIIHFNELLMSRKQKRCKCLSFALHAAYDDTTIGILMWNEKG